MRYQKGDLLYVLKPKSYPDEYILITGEVRHKEGIYEGFSGLRLSDYMQHYYSTDWLDRRTKKIG